MTLALPQALDSTDEPAPTRTTVEAIDAGEPKVVDEIPDPESQQSNVTTNDPVDKIQVKSDLDQKPTEKIMKRSLVIEENMITKLYKLVTDPLRAVMAAPKVNSVLKNIGTCMVNGMVELISYYFPPPLIPLIASAAGLLIPFEPVVVLRDKMPVTSYRRAFLTAVNTFMRSFNRYKIDDNYIDDPYMMQRFNRRMNSVGHSQERAINKDHDQVLE